jgi:Ca-activated chloride channel family protein
VVEIPVEVWAQKGELRRELTPADFAVSEGGEPRRVLSVAPLGGEPWRFVVYVDRVLSGTRSVRAASGAIAERLQALVGLGTVELVVAEPEPRVVVEATRDAKAFDEALSRLFLLGEGRDDARQARQRFRERLGRRAEDDDPVELVEEAVADEARLVRRQQERLATWLAGRERGRPSVLFLVSDGFDLDPRGFYLAEIPRAEAPPRLAETLAANVLDRDTLETARLAAALGWTVFPLPMGDESLPDVRRWRPTSSPRVPIGVAMTLPGPKGTGAAGEKPELPLPTLLAPREALRWLAEASGGAVLTSRAEVAGAIARLRSRWLVAYETSRPEAGPSRSVEVIILDPKLAIRARRWEGPRHLEEVAALRARGALAGEDEPGTLQVGAQVRRAPVAGDVGVRQEDQGLLEVRLDDDSLPALSADARWRLSLALPAEDAEGGNAEVSHRLLAAGDLVADPDGWTWRGTLPLTADTERLAVVVEDLASGAWGGDVAALTTDDEADPAAAPAAAGPVVRLARPAGVELRGKVRLRATAGSAAGVVVERVVFLVDGRDSGSCSRPPCEAEVDLGSRVRPHVLQVVGYGVDGAELGRDTLRINQKGEGSGFAVRILEPLPGRRVGPVDVEAEIRVPEGRRLERVEFFWNDELAGTLYAPPFRHRVRVPADRSAGYVRVAALLDDGASAEDAVPLNAADLGERVDVRLRELYVVVTDRAGKPVRGLSRDRFKVRQDGIEQEITTFEDAGSLPLTLALAIDSSASMFRKLENVQRAAASLLRGGLTSRDSALLVDFDTHPRLVTRPTRDLVAVASALDFLRADGSTGQWEAVAFSLDQLRGVAGRKALVVYSDGVGEGEPYSYRTCLRLARQSGVPLYLIVTNSESAVRAGGLLRPYSAKLRDLAASAGGNVYFVQPEDDLAGVYGDILSELRSQYTLAFYPKDSAEGWREVRVEVNGGGLTARTVSGYYGE